MTRMPALLALGLALCALLSVGSSIAQEQPPATEERDAISPQVDTTANTMPDTAPQGDASPSTPAAPADAGSPSASRPQRFSTVDRIELDSTAITGNRELPKVLYIVPWKRADLGDLIGRPANSLLDEVLTPVDREVFQRQTDYFEKLNAEVLSPAEPAR